MRSAAPRSLATGLALLGLAGCAGGPAQRFGWHDEPQPRTDSGSPTLEAYKDSFYAALGDRVLAHRSTAELLQRAAAHRVLYLGDRHDDDAWHDHVEALLDRLERRGVPLVFGCESFGTADAGAVRDFLSGRIDMPGLRQQLRARWPDAWLDNPHVDAPFFRRLLHRARRSGAPVFALEPTPRLPLLQRDAVIAGNIRRAAARYPEALVVVVVGQAHLLGQGDLIARTGLPSTAVIARPSERLRPHLGYGEPEYAQTRAGVFVWRPARPPGLIPRRDPNATF